MNAPDLLDPVTLKEIYGISRRGQTYVGRVLYVGVIALILYEFWSINVAEVPFLSPSAYAELGRQLFTQFVPFQMLMVTLAAIGASADRIIREDSAGTLGLLLLTPLTARRILMSKWKASMAQAGSLILCGVPVVAVCVYLGSVGPWDLLWCFALTGAMALLASAFGLRASAVCSTVPRALMLALLYMVGFALLPLALVFVGGLAAFFAAPFVHPAYAAGFLLFKPGASSGIWNLAWIPSTVVSVLVGRFIVGRIARPLEKRLQSPAARSLAVDSDEPTHPGELRTRPAKKPDPERKTREVWDRDPLLWKELLTRAGNRWTMESKALFIIYSLIFILLCWLFTKGMSLGTFAVLGGLFSLLSVVNGASLFAPEKEGRKLDMLLSSPVTSAAIIRSKLVAGLASPESIRVSLLALGTCVAFSWWAGPGILLYIAVFFIFMLFAFTLAATASLHARTLQGAALATTGILCVLLVVVPILASLLIPAPTGAASLQLPQFVVASINPVTVLEPLDRHVNAGAEAFGRFLVYAMVYGAAIAGLVGVLHLRFDRVMGRS
ncbi:MAG: ABC transporter permease subunit [Planctomycetaceae bacterium]|nr:ABC transporter permease subunit [Planctomycetaceae bacterium]